MSGYLSIISCVREFMEYLMEAKHPHTIHRVSCDGNWSTMAIMVKFHAYTIHYLLTESITCYHRW